MTREQLAHILRAATSVVQDGEILVIGSQAILGSFHEDQLPDPAWASIEADVAFWNDADNAKSDAVDGAIGELSMFHETFGIYGQGVSISTATLPKGWERRVVEFVHPNAGGSHARCLEPHDLVIAKLVANREKDLQFVGALINAGLVDCSLLRDRARTLDDSRSRLHVMRTVDGMCPPDLGVSL